MTSPEVIAWAESLPDVAPDGTFVPVPEGLKAVDGIAQLTGAVFCRAGWLSCYKPLETEASA